MNRRIDFVKPSQISRFKRTFRTGGSVTALEPSPSAEMLANIEQSLRMDIPDSIRKDLLNQKELIQRANEVTLDDVDEVDQDNEYSLASLSNGQFFKDNNTKILGTLKETTDRYNKPIEIVVGDISDLKKIEVQDDFLQFDLDEDYAVSTSSQPISEQIKAPENQSFIEEVIEESDKTINRKKAKPKQKAKPRVEGSRSFEPQDKEIQTTEQIFKKLNPDISIEELKVYLYYKDISGDRFSDEWYRITGLPGYVSFNSDQVYKWVIDGLLFYYNGGLYPKPIYLSGDIYKKISRIVKVGNNSGQDIDYITRTYSDKVLDRQIDELQGVYQKVYSDRLQFTGDKDDNSLILKPIDKICETYKVEGLKDHDSFRWFYRMSKIPGTNEYESIIAFDKETGNKKTFDSLSLQDAFVYYLLSEGINIETQKNITTKDIVELGIYNKVRQTPRGYNDQEKEQFKAQLDRTRNLARIESERLFLKFLDEQLLSKDKLQLEFTWNEKYNNYVEIDYNKIPVAFNVTKEFFGEDPFIVKPEKREAVAFALNRGSGCLAYDVGVGKTMASIMIMEQFIVAGYSKRPVVIVPNQTYKQWISEIRNVLPHRKVNDFYNLGVDIESQVAEIEGDNIKAFEVDEGSITCLTYQGLQKLGFNDDTSERLLDKLYDILNQGGLAEASASKRASFRETLEKLVGRAEKGTLFNIEDFNFDFLCYDEAHALKKVFTSVKGEMDEVSSKRSGTKQYDIISGTPSDRALKGFMLSQYVQDTNKGRNVLMLTATPFTNSPLEIYSMLSLVGWTEIEKLGLKNINQFFNTFIDAQTELVVNHRNEPAYKQIVKGFNNLPALQKLIFKYFNYKTGEDVGVVRPNKYVIPYTKVLVNNQITELPKSDQVLAYLEPSPIQKAQMNIIRMFAEEKVSYLDLLQETIDRLEGDPQRADELAKLVDRFENIDPETIDNATAIITMNMSRDCALSPYLYTFNDLPAPDYLDFVRNSPKVEYTMKCIQSVKEYHESKGQAVGGQVIYIDRGLKFFPLMKEYLIKEVGFKKHEIGFIMSKGMNVEQRKRVQNLFLGKKFDEKLGDFVKVSDDERIKVLIGSSSIKEGMNLQKKSTTLYNLFIDWNPTDNLQLAGRVWRQGNMYKNVRIVNPLLNDSADVFMFQKLEEKTARINSIWSNDGRSALPIEEIDPEELKLSLIKDPETLARFEIIREVASIDDDLGFYKSIEDRISKYDDLKNQLNGYRLKDNLRSLVRRLSNEYDISKYNVECDYRSNDECDTIGTLKALKRIYSAKQINDLYGRKVISASDRQNLLKGKTQEEINEIVKNLSDKELPGKSRWVDLTSWLIKVRAIEREEQSLFKARGIDPKDPDAKKELKESAEKKISELEERKAVLNSKENLTIVANEIAIKQAQLQIEQMTIDEAVQDFEKLNYLLNFTYCKIKASKPELSLEELIKEGIEQMQRILPRFEGDPDEKIILEGIEQMQKILKNT
jgi:hypothetical protein